MQEPPPHEGQDLDQVSQYSDRSRRSTKRRWRSISRRTVVLSSFAFLFVVLISTIITLRGVDKRQVGFGVSPSTSHYVWKFGPTAIIVAIIALWRQMEYRIKTQAALKQMIRTSSPAKLSVLLDYVSPIAPSALYASLKNKHWDVALGIGISMLLKLLLVFSTALFALQLSTLPPQQAVANLARGSARQDIEAAADAVALSYISWRQRNMSMPRSAWNSAAFQELSDIDSSFPPNSTVTAEVKAFFPSLKCVIANGSGLFDPQEGTATGDENRWVRIQVNYTSELLSDSLTLSQSGCNPETATCSPERLVPYFEFKSGLEADTRTDLLVAALLSITSEIKPGNVRAERGQDNKYPIQEVLDGNGWQQRISLFSAVVCKADYAIEIADLTAKNADGLAWTNKTLSTPQTSSQVVLPDYTREQMNRDVMLVSAQLDKYVAPQNENPSLWSKDWSPFTTLFELMLLETAGHDIAYFKDPNALIEPATRVYQGIAATWVGTWLDFPDHLTGTSTFTFQSDRLRTSRIAAWTMVALLSTTLSCVLVILWRHMLVQLPAQSGLLLEDSVSLQENESWSHILAKLGEASDKDMKTALSGLSFRTHAEDMHISASRIIESESKPPGGLWREHLKNHFASCYRALSRPFVHCFGKCKIPSTTVNGIQAPWSELPSNILVGSFIVVLIVMSVIGLELVQRLSDSQNTSLKLRLSQSSSQDIISVVPASIMLAISLLFDSTEFVVAVSSSYLQMSRVPVPISQLYSSPMRHLRPVALVKEIRFGKWWASVIMFGALIGSFLTIISSALYTISIVPGGHPINIQTIDEFDFNAVVLRNSTVASSVFTHVQRSNESYPRGTFEEIAYPEFELDRSDAVVRAILDNGDRTSVTVQIPAIRASLSCSTIPQNEMTLNADQWTGDGGQNNANFREFANLTSISTLPSQCQLRSPAYSNSTEYRVDPNKHGTVYEGYTSYNAEFGSPNGVMPGRRELLTVDQFGWHDQYPSGCPSIAFTVGTYQFGTTDTSTSTRLICTQRFDKIPATLTFTVPGMELDTNRHPILDEDQASLASDLTLNFTEIYHFPSSGSVGSDEETHSWIDEFFQAVIYGLDGVPLDELLGHQNQQRLADAVQRVYRLYMAQVVGQIMRSTKPNVQKRQLSEPDGIDHNVNTTKIGTRFSGTIQDTTDMRVIQHRTPKIILQVMLSTMVVCFILGWKDLVAMGKILPHNPCTIAGRMSFLAGSRFVENIDSSLDDRDLREKLEKEQTRLRFGWWKDAEFRQTTRTPHMKGDAKGDMYVAVKAEETDEEAYDSVTGSRRYGIDVAR